MRELLQTLNAAPDIEFEKCGEIIWAPQRNVFVCCCWRCHDFFMGLPAFTRHVRRHKELDDVHADESSHYSEEEQENEEQGKTTNVLGDTEKLVSVYTVEDLLDGETVQEYRDDNRQLEHQKNMLQLIDEPENAIGCESPAQDAALSDIELVECVEEMHGARECGENSIFLCELQGEELSVNVCNEYDGEISALMQCDNIATIEYSVEEVEQILEADKLLSVSPSERSWEPIDDAGAKQSAMDSGLGLEETFHISTEIKNKSNKTSSNLMADTILSKPAMVNATAKKLDVPIKLVEAFYKDFKPRIKMAPIKLPNKRRKLAIKHNTLKNWNKHIEKSDSSDASNRSNIRNNNMKRRNMRYNKNNSNGADKPFILNPIGDKPLSLISSAKTPDFTSNAMDNDFLAALQLTANSSGDMIAMKQGVLAQSTPKENLPKNAQNGVISIRSDHFEVERTRVKKIYNYFQATLENMYTSKMLPLKRAPLKCVSSSQPGIVRNRQMLQRMQQIKRALLQVTDKENHPKNQACDTSNIEASNKQLVPNNTLPKILSVEVLNGCNLPPFGGNELASKSAKTAATGIATPSVGSVSDMSVEFLQQQPRASIVNLSSFDCILNDVRTVDMDSTIDCKPNTSLEIIKIPDEVELIDELQTTQASDSSQLNISNSSVNTTTTVLDDMKLLDLVGLKIIQKPDVECGLTLTQVEAMRFRALQFAVAMQKISKIWINELHINKSHELMDHAFAKLTAETNILCHRQLATHHLKRIVNLVIMWYSGCCRARLFNKKATPTAQAPYLQFFEFLPKTGRRWYYCEFCALYFRTETRYLQHRVVHTGQQPYKCQHCERNFVRRKSLQNHEMNCRSLDSKCNDTAAASPKNRISKQKYRNFACGTTTEAFFAKGIGDGEGHC